MKWILLATIAFGGVIASSGLAYAQCPDPLEAATPGYPQLPSGGRDSGEVQVQVAISPSGEVTTVHAISGPERLRVVAENAAREWRFQTQGKAAEKCLITFAFILRSGLRPAAVSGVFKAPNRIEIFAEERKVVTISDPPMEDGFKAHKAKQQ